MTGAFIAVIVVQTILIIVLAAGVLSFRKRAVRGEKGLAECNANLSQYDGIDDAQTHLEKLDTKLSTKKAEFAELERILISGREELSAFDKEKSSFEKQIRGYQKVVGDFKSAEMLRKHVNSLQATIGKYENIAELDLRISAQRLELQKIAKALDVKADAKQILGKVQYFTNLVEELKDEADSIEETIDLQHFGIYRPQFNFDHSDEYKGNLNRLVQNRKDMVKEGMAIHIPEGITVGGDERQGRKLGQEYAKVMLRAFNGEADAAIAKAKYNNMAMLQKRMAKSYEAINKLGKTMNIEISQEYLNVRTNELKLAYEYERKKQEERDEQAALREQAKEEEKVRKQAEKAQREAEAQERREQQRLEEKEKLLSELKAQLDITKHGLSDDLATSNEEKLNLQSKLQEQQKLIEELESQRNTLISAVKDAHERTQNAVSLAQLTKRGHVYILSNVGSFGSDCFKIGMTRREDPNDRVKELGSASVPFPFDIHAMILTNDAPALELALHKYFGDRRVNKVNNRKEFFQVTMEEIKAALNEVHDTPVKIRQVIPEAAEYRETLAIVEDLDRNKRSAASLQAT